MWDKITNKNCKTFFCYFPLFFGNVCLGAQYLDTKFCSLLLCCNKNYLSAIQLKEHRAPRCDLCSVRLVKLESKGSVQLKSKVKICICIYIIN